MTVDTNTLQRMGFERIPPVGPHGSLWMRPDATIATEPVALEEAEQAAADPTVWFARFRRDRE